MIAKYTIEYMTQFKGHAPTYHYRSDDPVACEEFLLELLERGFQIKAIRHEGVELPRMEADKMIRTAAGMLAAKNICSALGISIDEERHRFGFAA